MSPTDKQLLAGGIIFGFVSLFVLLCEGGCSDPPRFELSHTFNVPEASTELEVLDTGTEASTELEVLDTGTEASTELEVLDTGMETSTELEVLDTGMETSTELEVFDTGTEASTELEVLDTGMETSTEIEVLDTGMETSTEIEVLDTGTEAPTELEVLDTGTEAPTELCEQSPEICPEMEISISETDTGGHVYIYGCVNCPHAGGDETQICGSAVWRPDITIYSSPEMAVMGCHYIRCC